MHFVSELDRPPTTVQMLHECIGYEECEWIALSTIKMDANNLTSAQKNELMMRVRSEVQAQAMQELNQTLLEKCFDKCITRPQERLDSKQQNCLALCINRYVETIGVVSQAISQRAQQQ